MNVQHSAGRGSARRSWLLIAAIALLVLGCATACGGGSSSNAAKLPTPPPSTSISSTAHKSQVGMCHLDTVAGLKAEQDNTPPVPCTRPHNLETVSVHAIYGTPTRSSVHSYWNNCAQDAGSYLHTDLSQVNGRIFIDPLASTQNGKPEVMCDIGTIGKALSGNESLARYAPVTTSTSLRQQARSGHTASWHLCGKHLAVTFPLTPCTQPHRLEALFHYISMPLTDGRYPAGGSDHNSRGDAICRHALASRPDASRLSVHSHWVPQALWKNEGSQSTLYGVCWFWRTDGSDLPAVS